MTSTVEADFARLRHLIAHGRNGVTCDRCRTRPTYGMTLHLKTVPGAVMVVCAGCARSTDNFAATGIFGIERGSIWREGGAGWAPVKKAPARPAKPSGRLHPTPCRKWRPLARR